ncbi:MAG: hypothetical protein LBI05_01140 [Planctomycetaceae bacterium]|jgi:hypothetical protein|nr:hypothetical protein [Planctomycetaceae bacterium]
MLFVMSLVRFVSGTLCFIAVWLTAAAGWSAEQSIDQQIAERTQQYQESLRQRASQLSPSFQAKVESHAQQTVSRGLEKWKRGEVAIQVALPRWSALQFVVRHFPFSGSPAGAFVFGGGTVSAALTVTTFQYVVKSVSTLSASFANLRSFAVSSLLQRNDGISYFVRIVCTIVLRR